MGKTSYRLKKLQQVRDIYSNTALLLARFGIASLFISTSFAKIIHFAFFSMYMQDVGMLFPTVSAFMATAIELLFGLSLLLGLCVRPLSAFLAIYMVLAAFIGHPYWAISGLDHFDQLLHFYKNLAIAGGGFALSVAGAGRYSLSAFFSQSDKEEESLS